jgi:hypothetical protein
MFVRCIGDTIGLVVKKDVNAKTDGFSPFARRRL